MRGEGEMSENEPPRSKECIVAYLDLLGVKEKILNDDDSETNLAIIRKLYNEVIALQNEKNPTLEIFQTCKFKIFSDNIVFIQELSNDPNDSIDAIEGLFRIFGVVADFQYCAFVNHGWLLRGGIVQGPLYSDEDIVWGKALVASHYLEDKLAIFPRVIIDEQLHQLILKSESHIKDIRIKIDSDGYSYVDYLNFMFIDGLNPYQLTPFLTMEFPKIQNTFIDMLSKVPTDAKPESKSIRAKYRWQINYYNGACKETGFEEYCVDPGLILSYEEGISE